MVASAKKKIDDKWSFASQDTPLPVSPVLKDQAPSLTLADVINFLEDDKNIRNQEISALVPVKDVMDNSTCKKFDHGCYKLDFSTDAGGPSFGPLQLNLATDIHAQVILSNILASASLSSNTINIILKAAEFLCSINATSHEKEYFFATQVGYGNRFAGEARLSEIDALLFGNAGYINRESSAIYDFQSPKFDQAPGEWYVASSDRSLYEVIELPITELVALRSMDERTAEIFLN